MITRPQLISRVCTLYSHQILFKGTEFSTIANVNTSRYLVRYICVADQAEGIKHAVMSYGMYRVIHAFHTDGG